MNIFRDENNSLKLDFRYARTICRLIQNNNYKAVFAGGVVRDIIQEVQYNDIDIATDCPYNKLLDILKFFNDAKIKEVGKAFGVVLITIDGFDFEIARFRSDFNCDGRHPKSIQFCSMEEDAKRRDFTMNAVFYDPISEEFYDFVGGIDDIKNRKLKFVGNAEDRIREDYFRILRYLRFLTKNYEFDPKELQTVDKMSKDLFAYVAPERIQIELMEKLLKCNMDNLILVLVMLPTLFKALFSDIEMLLNTSQDQKWHPEGSALIHTFCILQNLYYSEASPHLLLAGLFHDTGKATTTEICNGKITSHGHEKESERIVRSWMSQMKFSNDDIEYVCGLVSDHMKLHQKGMSKSTLRKLMAKQYFNDLLLLNKCDILASNNNFEVYDEYISRIKEINENTLPQRLVTGNDLISIGLKPGENFGKILNFLFDLQLEGKFSTKEDGLCLVIKSIYNKMLPSVACVVQLPIEYLKQQDNEIQEIVNKEFWNYF